MQVFKFGGASVTNVGRIKSMAGILQKFKGEKLLIIVSAMGKTTNALEKVADAYYNNRQEEAFMLFNQIKQQHTQTANQLLVTNALSCDEQLLNFFTEAEWLLHDKPVRTFDYYYDQIVCTGELFSTTIISHYLNEAGIKNTWIDVRDLFRTDDNFRDAAIDWEKTQNAVEQSVLPLFKTSDIILTQGFIGATDQNESTTLGREGSDFSAAVFANLLNAKSQTIWKDVPAVMNADPKEFTDALPIEELNYTEVIEMAYYGAQVIHPKTIKPLQNKNIPLYVKSFLDPSLPGTVIHKARLKDLPPIIVLKRNQVMMELKTKDFSFVEEKPVVDLFSVFKKWKVKPNLTQNAAISIICVLDDHPEKIEKLALEAAKVFDVKVTRELTLLTIRHFTRELYDKLTIGKKTLLQQRTQETIQAVLQ